jgi:hypothetical protein
MSSFIGHSAFEPDELNFAQSVLDEVWALLPCEVRNGSDSNIFRERLASRALAAIRTAGREREELKLSLMQSDVTISRTRAGAREARLREREPKPAIDRSARQTHLHKVS